MQFQQLKNNWFLKTGLFLCLWCFIGNSAIAQQKSHHKLTAQQYQNKVTTYHKQGYRLVHVDGYNVGSKVFYAARWAKGGAAIAAKHGMSGAEYGKKFLEYKKKGYRLAVIDGVGVGNKAVYAAIWKKQKGVSMATHHGMSYGDYGKKFVAYKKKGYRLTWIEGFGVGNKAFYNAIWEKKTGGNIATFHKMTSADYQKKVNDYAKKGFRLTLVNAYNIGAVDYYAAIWEKRTSRRTLSARHHLSVLGYQNEFDNHNYSGFKLKHVTGYARNGKLQYAGIWESTNAWSSSDRNNIDQRMRTFMKDNKIPGASIAIIKNEKLLFAKGYGVLDKSTRVPVGPKSLFRIASSSKPITSAAIMKLRDKKPNLLKKKVLGKGSILGTGYSTSTLSAKEKAITVQHLLEHTAGGNQWNNKGDGDFSDPMMMKDDASKKKLISWVLDSKNPETMPGKKWDYSNFGYCLLGEVIKKVSGSSSYEQYVRQNVLKPCGITTMRIASNKKKDKVYNEATYHHDNAYENNTNRMDAHGGWIASSIDLAKFLVRVDGRGGKKDIISKGSYIEMLKPCSVESGYAKGWFRSSTSQWHGGYLWGTGALIYNRPNGESWVILYNSSWIGSTDKVMKDMMKSVKTWPSHDLF